MTEQLPKIIRAWDSGKNEISYVYRDKQTNKKKIGKTKFHWWFYILTSDWNKHKANLANFLENGTINKTEDEGKYTRIYVDRKHNSEFLNKQLEYVWEYNNWNYNKLLNALDILDIQTFEADILPYKRWLLQENVEIENEYKVLLYDIETDDRPHKIEVGKERIVSFAVKDANTGAQKFHILKEFTDEAEKELLTTMAKYFNRYDVVVSWNGSNFDDPYVRARFARYSIIIDYRKFLTQDHLKIFRTYGPKLTNYRLDTVGEEVCGINKVEHIESIYEMWKNNKKLLKKYNLRDVEIMYEIEKKTGFLGVARDINIIGKCFVDDVYITRKVDNMIVLQAQKDKHYHFKTKIKVDDNDVKKKKFKGAYVFEPVPGYYHDVNVLDFSSLYPNVIKTFNISPDTLITPELEDVIPEEMRITSVTGAQFRKDILGIIPKVIMQMKEKRDYYKGLMANYDKGSMEHDIYDRLQYCYKSFGLSFYGAIGETHSRFYDVKVAESVTQGGVYFNKLCSKKCKQMDANTIYGDSVTGERCTVIKEFDEVNIVTFEELFKMTDVKIKERGKEFGRFDNLVLTLSYNFKTNQSEWKPIKTVIRHKTNKQIYGYRTRHGMSKLTADHSLINSNGKCFKPIERFDSFHIPVLKNETIEITDDDSIRLSINDIIYSMRHSSEFDLPQFVYNLPIEFKKYFIEMLLNISNNFKTSSTKLASAVCYIANEIDYKPIIRYENNVYIININNTYDKIITENKCEKMDYCGYVYDLSVEDNHNFVDAMGNLLLHNTDSVFLDGLKRENVKNTTNILKKLCKLHAVKKFNCDECTLKMEYDKGFSRLIVVSKKRYAGLITFLDGHFLEEQKMYVAGLEYKRTDWCKFARDKQYELIKWLLQPDLPNVLDVKAWLLRQKEKIFNHEVTLEEIAKSEKITKPLEEYNGRYLNKIVALQMEADGKEVYVGDKVVYFIRSVNIKNQPNPEPDYKWDGRYAEMYYWNHMIYPALQRILEAVYKNVNWQGYNVSGTRMNQKIGRTLLW